MSPDSGDLDRDSNRFWGRGEWNGTGFRPQRSQEKRDTAVNLADYGFKR